MSTWKELRNELDITPEEQEIIDLEKRLIKLMVEIREKQNLSQAELAKMCNMKQPMIARLEKDVHSPRLDSILKVLAPLGYTLRIVPLAAAKERGTK